MALTKITDLNKGNGFTSENLNKVFRKKCRVYVAKDRFATTDIPTSAAEVVELYESSGTPTFIPLGRLNEESGKLTFEQEKLKIDFGTIPGKVKITAELHSLMLTPDMLEWLDGDTARGDLSFLFVPDGEEGQTFLALNGVTITSKGEFLLKGDLSVVDIMIEEEANKIADKILYENFALPTGDE